MKRNEFLALWENAKQENIYRDGDNQYAYASGTLVSVDVFYEGEWSVKEGGIECPDYSEDEQAYDTLLDGTPDKWTEFSDCLLVCYYRKNEYTTRFDFYNNEVERGFDDWQESYQTEYWVVGKDGVPARAS